MQACRGPSSPGLATRAGSVMILALAGSGCGVKTNVVMLDPAGPTFGTVSPDSVLVFASPSSVRVDYDSLAILSAGGRSSGALAPDEAAVIASLKEEAGGLGADGIILGEILAQRPASATDRTLPARGSAVAIRIGDGASGPPALQTSARSMEEIRTIALLPVIRVDGRAVPDTIRSEFERDVSAELDAAGFNTVSVAIHDSVRRAHILAVGDLFDPLTGQRDDRRWRLVEQRTRKTLIDEYEVDGFLVEEIWTVPAFYSGTVAEWDGTRQSLTGPEAVTTDMELAATLLDVLLCSDEDTEGCEDESEGFRGALAALSFMVRVESTIGAMLYTGRGGIEVLELLDDSGEPYAQPAPHPFDTRERNRAAVALALAHLVDGRGP